MKKILLLLIILASIGMQTLFTSCNQPDNQSDKVIKDSLSVSDNSNNTSTSSIDSSAYYDLFHDTAYANVVIKEMSRLEDSASKSIKNKSRIAKSAVFTKTRTDNIYYSKALGVHDSLEHLYFDIVQPNNTKPHALFICNHGGGGFFGDKSGGMHPLMDELVTNLGITIVYPNYRLADTKQFLHKTIPQSTILMWEEMYRSLQDNYSLVCYLLSHNDIYHIDPNQIINGGVSFGAVMGVMSVSWQSSEYGMLDTMKWRNTSNPNIPFNVKGSICVSGAAFTLDDIDATNKFLILCYGGLDNTLKCNGGSNHRCPYIGTCQILSQSSIYGNLCLPLYIANAGHCMKGSNAIQSAQFLFTTKNFIKDNLKPFVH